MTDGIDRRERLDLLDWFEGLASSRGYVFAMRELYPKQKEKLISWGFTVTTVGKVERSNALELCGVSALGAPKIVQHIACWKLQPSAAKDLAMLWNISQLRTQNHKTSLSSK